MKKFSKMLSALTALLFTMTSVLPYGFSANTLMLPQDIFEEERSREISVEEVEVPLAQQKQTIGQAYQTLHFLMEADSPLSPVSKNDDPLVQSEAAFSIAQVASADAYNFENGTLVIEAENYLTQTQPGTKVWNIDTNESDYSGTSALKVGPDTGANISEANLNLSPRLDYQIYVPEGEGGTYKIWVRGLGQNIFSDSLHVGINGTTQAGSGRVKVNSFGGFEWTNTTMDSNDTGVATLDLTPGEHTLNVWMREDGFMFDKILLTNTDDVPTGHGPQESLQGDQSGDTTAPVISNVQTVVSKNSVTITWNTDEPSTSHVEYGLSNTLGTLTPVDSTLKTAHSVEINNLDPDTQYFFKVLSEDSDTNLAESSTADFTTDAEPEISSEAFLVESGAVSIEAESFFANTPAGGRSWDSLASLASFSGTDALVVLPNTGANVQSDNLLNSPRLDYKVYVPEGEEGTYTIWVRGRANTHFDDSLHVGVNGSTQPSSDRVRLGISPDYSWTNTTMDNNDTGLAQITLGAGEQTLNVWMREDGFTFDKIYLTKNSDTPTGVGPEESAQAGDVAPEVPTGTVEIEGGAIYTNSLEVHVTVQNISSPNPPSNLTFSTDGVNFSSQTIYVPSNPPGDPYYRIQLPGGDGLKTVYVRLEDASGNVGIITDTITLDRTSPANPTISFPDYFFTNDYFYGFDVPLDLSANDALSGMSEMRFSLDGGTRWTDWEPYETSRTVTWAEATTLYDYDDTNVVEFVVEYKDVAGNVSSAEMTSVRDGGLPHGTIETQGGQTVFDTREVTFNLTASDSLSGIQGVRIGIINDDLSRTWLTDFGPLETPKTLMLPDEDGNYVIVYEVCDYAACIYLIEVFITLDRSGGIPELDPETFLVEGGAVSIEAESYVANTPAGGKSWDSLVSLTSFSGADALVAYPNTGANVSETDLANSPRLDYKIFVPEGDEGTYTIWVRGLANTSQDDSIHIGVNGSTQPTSDRVRLGVSPGYSWTNTTMDNNDTGLAQITLGAGEQTLNVWMREDGFTFDKIYLTKNGDTPVGVGPAESAQAGDEPLATFQINGGDAYTNNVDVTLDLSELESVEITATITEMQFSFDGDVYTPFEPFSTTKSLTLPPGEGEKTIYVILKDASGLESTPFMQTITLDQTAPGEGSNHDDYQLKGALDNPDPDYITYFGLIMESVNGNLLTTTQYSDTNEIRYSGSALLLDGDVNSETYGELLIEFGNPNPLEWDYFGRSSGVNGNYVFIGASNNGGVQLAGDGIVYMYDGDPLSPTFGDLIHTFSNPDPDAGDNFGISIVGLGDYVAIANSLERNVESGGGVVHIFDSNPSSSTFGNLIATFENPVSRDFPTAFGGSMAARGTQLLIGALLDGESSGEFSGSAHLFDADPTSSTFGNVLKSFYDPSPARWQEFGWSFAFAGDHIAIGNKNTNDGEVYLFNGNLDSPEFGKLLTRFQSPESPNGPNFPFGISLASVGTQVVIGDFYGGEDSGRGGRAYVYEADPNKDNFGRYLQTIGNQPIGSTFGLEMVVAGDRLYIAATGLEYGGNNDAGRIYYYEPPVKSFFINKDETFSDTRDVTLHFNVEDIFAPQETLEMAFSEDGGFSFSPFEPYADMKNYSLSPGSGLKEIKVRLRDPAGNISEFSDSITLNQLVLPGTQPPTGSISVNGTGSFTSPNIEVQLTAADDVSVTGMSFSFDAETWTPIESFAATKQLTLPAGEGKKTVYVRYFDEVYNESNIYAVPVSFDLTPPTFAVDYSDFVGMGTIDNPNPAPEYFNDTYKTKAFGGGGTTVVGKHLLVGSGRLDSSGSFLSGGRDAYLINGDPESEDFGNVLMTFRKPNNFPNDSYGKSVAASEDYVFVGAPRASELYTESGVVYVFDGNPESSDYGKYLFSIQSPASIPSYGWFGDAMVVVGNTLVVSSAWDGPNPNGAVFLFDIDPASTTFGEYVDTLQVSSSGNPAGHDFGQTLLSYGDKLLVGAPASSGLSDKPDEGVYIFDMNPESETYKQVIHVLSDPVIGASRGFGRSFGIAGDMIAIGSKDTSLGEVPLFNFDFDSPTFGELYATMRLPEGASEDGFSYAIESFGTSFVLSSDVYGTFSPTGEGEVFIYEADRNKTDFGKLLKTIESPYPVNTQQEQFGKTFIELNGKLLIGAPGAGFATVSGLMGQGEFHVYEPTGVLPAVVINYSSPQTNSRNVELSFNLFDNVSDVEDLELAFSQDGGTTFTAFEPYASTKLLSLTPGNGEREVTVRVRDLAGHTADFTDTILLQEPIGAVSINTGDEFTNSVDVNLTLSAGLISAISPIAEMSFSLNGRTWTSFEPFASTKSFSLADREGEQFVYVKYRDTSGNESGPISDTIKLDKTGPSAERDLSAFVKLDVVPFPGSQLSYPGANVLSIDGDILVGITGLLSEQGELHLLEGDSDRTNYGESLKEFTYPSQSDDDLFGSALAANATHIFASAPMEQTTIDFFGYQGAIQMFDRDQSSPTFGELIHTFLRPMEYPSSRGFGEAIAVWDDYLIVSAANASTGGPGDAGVVYIYNADVDSSSFGELVKIIRSPAPSVSGEFGESLLVKDGRLWVGQPASLTTGSNGSVFVFNLDESRGPIGMSLGRIDYPGLSSDRDSFGITLAEVNGYILVGDAFFANPSVYMFEGDVESPDFGNLIHTFDSPDTWTSDNKFGMTISVRGTQVAIGAEDAGESSQRGAVYVFEADVLSPDFGQIIDEFEDEPTAFDGSFGHDVEFHGDQLLVVSPLAYEYPEVQAGKMSVYENPELSPFLINNGDEVTNSFDVNLNFQILDNLSDVLDLEIAFSQDGGSTFTSFEAFSETMPFTLTPGEGLKEVIVRVRDLAGNESDFSDTIILELI